MSRRFSAYEGDQQRTGYYCSVRVLQAPKKGININNFARNPPPRPPPLQGTPDPVNSLCWGPPWPSNAGESPKHKQLFGGGVLGGPKFFMLKLFMYFSEKFQKPQPPLVSKKVRQYTSNLYGSTPPICIAVLSWLLSFEARESLQCASHLYCSTPPICTAVRPPFVRQYFWKNTGGCPDLLFLAFLENSKENH